MTNNVPTLFIITKLNELDHISPVLYTLGERNNINVDVFLGKKVSQEDYRVQAVTQFDNVSIIGMSEYSTKWRTVGDQIETYLKKFGRKLPSNLPKRVYNKVKASVQQSSSGRLHGIGNGKFESEGYTLVGMDWINGRSDESSHLAERNDITTVVLPHGDSPFKNQWESQRHFRNIFDDKLNFIERSNLFVNAYNGYEDMLKHDYILMPNQQTAKRVTHSANPKQVRVLGSPRYNQEWLEVLSDIRPSDEIGAESEMNVTIFLRREIYHVSKREVKNTIKLLAQFPNIHIIIKEHPRGRLLNPSFLDSFENVSLAEDGIPFTDDEVETAFEGLSSVSLIEWADVVMSVGTTIAFEAVMRRKPVLELGYATANYSIVSHYFPNADLRCKDELYQTIHNLLKEGTENFYDDNAHERFVEEMVTNSKGTVLDSWAEFIETRAIEQSQVNANRT